jgi:Protein of unknown function (DUF4058)
MASPFPGMDPYLEGGNIWPDVHHSLIPAMRDALVPQVAPAYYVRIELRTYIVRADQDERVARPDTAVIAVPSGEGKPMGRGTVAAPTGLAQTIMLPRYEEVQEGYLEIRDVRTDEVVTAIELLSPTNKAPGSGRSEYEEKRHQVLRSQTSFVEIDLLRGGEPMEMEPMPRSDYRIVVSPGWERPRAQLYSLSLRDAIPEVPVPLRRGEDDAILPLGTLLSDLYDRARYDVSLDYHRDPPEPRLSPADAAWIDQLLQGKGLRKARPCP